MKIAFRPATPHDSDFVYATKKDALGPYIEKTWGWDEQFQLEFHRKDFEPDKTEIIILDGAPAGWLLKTKRPDYWELNEIYLPAQYRRRGIGGRIVADYAAEASAANMLLKLGVLKVNPARAFYERHGFVVEAEDEHYFKMIKKPNRVPVIDY